MFASGGRQSRRYVDSVCASTPDRARRRRSWRDDVKTGASLRSAPATQRKAPATQRKAPATQRKAPATQRKAKGFGIMAAGR